MFRISGNAFTSHKAHFAKMAKALPGAHREASARGAQHVLQSVKSAAEEAGWNPKDSITLVHAGPKTWIHVSPGPDGDRVFDHEFGTPERAPNPVLRNTARAAEVRANIIYGHHLLRKLGT